VRGAVAGERKEGEEAVDILRREGDAEVGRVLVK
jgi:hypothetical protein